MIPNRNAVEDPPNQMMRRSTLLLGLALIWAAPVAAQEPCGGVERWAVKVGADPDSQINTQPIPISIHNLSQVQKLGPIPSNDFERLPTERSVYVVDGFLVKFKLEAGKTGDSDYHLVVTDETLMFASGAGNPGSTHSFIAEIVDPDCVMGRNSTVSSPSVFANEMTVAKAALEAKFPERATGSGWTDAEGIPVRITGVGFFDRPHGQTGRATNGLELHPILKIEFNPSPGGPSPGPARSVERILVNAGFEEGQDPWNASNGVITDDSREPARTGTFKAWLGGFGEPHTDKLCREVTIPESATTASMSFFLHISSEEQTSTGALDTLKVQVRKPSNTVKTLATFSNLQAKRGFQLRTFDLTAFKGQTVKFCLSSKEDAGSVTSFVADDFSFVSQ
ncbi:MAG TPA: hypothetical protein VGW39_16540 [Chthoniobacterales bacterium]|nr:hypothetical protein [Chthoniobacterales bacterium]